jgi:NTP pyrophosphatase (non-canonical NTP hydrolase)
MTETLAIYKAEKSLNIRTKIINDINRERSRQDYLHPEKLPSAMRTVTIMEELGEVAKALQDDNARAVYRELIDVAASCVRMAEEVLEE